MSAAPRPGGRGCPWLVVRQPEFRPVREQKAQHLRASGAQDITGMGNGIITGSAGSRDHHRLACQSKFCRDVTGDHVAWISANKPISRPGDVPLHITIIEALNEMRFTGGSAHAYTGAVTVNAFQIQRCIGQSAQGRAL